MPVDNKIKKARTFIRLGWRVVLLLVGLSGAALGADSVVVLYPETQRPFQALFADILNGIEQRQGPVPRYALTDGYDRTALREWLDQQAGAVVITLGRLTTDAYDAMGLTTPHVIGALDLSPQTRPGASGISLAVDPPLFFAAVKLLAPNTRRVFMVFNPHRDQWIVDQAHRAAPSYGLTLVPREATDLKTSGQRHQQILQEASPETDAIWLPSDVQLIDTDSLLPYLIEESWNRRLVMGSSNLQHVNQGVLFCLYPDTEALGRRLADMAAGLAKRPRDKPGIEPLRDIKRALNLRVSRRLGLAIDKDVESRFDLVFPP